MPGDASDPEVRGTNVGITDRALATDLKDRILMENYFLPGQLEAAVATFVDPYNHRRYQESIGDLTPADVDYGATRPSPRQGTRSRNSPSETAAGAIRAEQHNLNPYEPEPSDARSAQTSQKAWRPTH